MYFFKKKIEKLTGLNKVLLVLGQRTDTHREDHNVRKFCSKQTVKIWYCSAPGQLKVSDMKEDITLY
jgi:hypothetical protein